MQFIEKEKFLVIVAVGIAAAVTVYRYLWSPVRALGTQTNEYEVHLPHHGERWPYIRGLLTKAVRNCEQFQALYTSINPKANKLSFFSSYLEKKGNPLIEEAHRDFYQSTLPFIQDLASRLPNLFPPEQRLHHLMPQNEGRVLLTREQVGCLLANAFFSTFTEPNQIYSSYVPNGALCSVYKTQEIISPTKSHEIFQSFNFMSLFSGPVGATHGTIMCLLNYFRRLKQYMPKENLVIYRHVIRTSDECINGTPALNNRTLWCNSSTPICNVRVKSIGKIEDDSEAEFHADFASKYIGGAALSGGCAQEEILFAFRPECMVSMLLCAALDSNEAIVISGAERFSRHEGTASSFRFVGDFREKCGIFKGTFSKSINIVAVDAMVNIANSEIHRKNILRELNKVFCGLNSWRTKTSSAIGTYATGHWGCGMFGNNKELKALQQIAAVSQAGLNIHYYTWGDREFADNLSDIVHFLQNNEVTVGKLASLLLRLENDLAIQNIPCNGKYGISFFDYVRSKIRK